MLYYICSAAVIATLGLIVAWLRQENRVPTISVPLDGRLCVNYLPSATDKLKITLGATDYPL